MTLLAESNGTEIKVTLMRPIAGKRWLRLFLLSALLFAPTCRPDGPVPTATVPVDSANRDLDALTLEQLMDIQVVSAALHPQTLQDAPASVTVITAEDIRKYGYRTLGEALSAVRGFYLSNDRSYETMGVRGFSLPGDYGSHLLVMVNGHNMADNVFDYMLYFGNDFPIDMNLIKQIEIIRGPSSALYGSNAIFATINIITKSPGEAGPLSFTADTGSFGEKKGQVVETASFGGVKLLLSASVFSNAGESPLFFPQYDTSQNNYGEAVNMTTERGYHFFSTLDLAELDRHGRFRRPRSCFSRYPGGPPFSITGARRMPTTATSSTPSMRVRSLAARCDGAPITTPFITKAGPSISSTTGAWKITAPTSSAIG